MKQESKIDRRNRILLGLEIAYKKMLEFKKQKKSELVIMRDEKIVRIKPE
jgi:hypothetical protein